MAACHLSRCDKAIPASQAALPYIWTALNLGSIAEKTL
jgi:hypothetical protein